MHIPRRLGVSAPEWERLIAPHDRARDRTLQRAADRTDTGGIGLIWYRTENGVQPQRLGIQPGVADDLPSLLSTLAAEVAWPGVEPLPDVSHDAAERAVAVWARVWQVREEADLRLLLRWDEQGQLRGIAELCPLDGPRRPLMMGEALLALLAEVAKTPRSSETAHGRLLAGNRAMAAADYARARAYYEQAVQELPRHPEAHRNLALALARLGEWERASEIMRQAWLLAPSEPAWEQEYLALETDAGVQAVREGDLRRAAAHFLRILQHWPQEPTALVNLGNLRLREGRTPEARAIFRRFLRLHPHHAVADEVRLALQELGDA